VGIANLRKTAHDFFVGIALILRPRNSWAWLFYYLRPRNFVGIASVIMHSMSFVLLVAILFVE